MKARTMLKVREWRKKHLRQEHYVADTEVAALGESVLCCSAYSEYIAFFYEIALAVDDMCGSAFKNYRQLIKVGVSV